MDQFFDGTHVRLRSREREKYLYADEDGVGVSLSRRRASLNAAWQVHLVPHGGMNLVLLRSAAYGRYLAVSPDMAPPGHRGRRAVQRDYDEPQLNAVRWRPIAVVTVDDIDDDDEAEEALDDAADVVLRHGNNRYLRANGRHRRWHTGVTVDDNDGVRTTMMIWTVEQIPPRISPPALPPPAANQEGPGFMSLLIRRAQPTSEPLRTIRYVRANNQGNFDQLGWATLQFYGRSVYMLLLRLAYHLHLHEAGDEGNVLGIVLCVRAGYYGRLTPLVTDLPLCEEPMDIVVLATDSYAAAQLQHPNVDEP